MIDRDYKPRATPGMFEEFMRGVVYQDFKNEIDVRIENARDMLEAPESQLNDGITHENVRGLVISLRQMQSIFTDLMLNSAEDLEREQQGEKRTE